MARPKVVDRSPVEILLDDRRADVGGAGNRRGVTEPLADCPHHGDNCTLCLGFGLGRPALGKRNRRNQGTAPRPEILGGEFFTHELADVVVQLSSSEAIRLVLEPVAEEPPTSGSQQLAHRVRELRINDGCPYPDSLLAPKAKGDPAAANLNVTLAESRNSECLVGLRVTVFPDSKPTEIDQSHGYRTCPFRRHRLELHVLRHRLAKCRQRFRKLNELVELRLLLRRPIIVVVAVLPPAGRVDAGCLQLRGRTRRDPHFLPRRWNRQRLDPLELLRVRDPPAARIQIAEPASRAVPRPPSFPGHLGPDAREFPHYTPARWTRSESSCSRATRPARSYSRKPCASSRRR